MLQPPAESWGELFFRSMASINKELKDILEKFEIDKKVGIDSSVLAKFVLSSISSLENLRDSIIEKEEKEKKKDSDDEEFVEQMYKLYPSKCPIQNRSLGKTSKDKDRIRKLLKRYTKEEIEFVIRNEVNQKYNKSWMSNFSTFLNNFPDPTQIDDGKGSICCEESVESNKVIISGVEYR